MNCARVAAYEDDAYEVVRSLMGLGLWGRSEDRELLNDDIYSAEGSARANLVRSLIEAWTVGLSLCDQHNVHRYEKDSYIYLIV